MAVNLNNRAENSVVKIDFLREFTTAPSHPSARMRSHNGQGDVLGSMAEIAKHIKSFLPVSDLPQVSDAYFKQKAKGKSVHQLITQFNEENLIKFQDAVTEIDQQAWEQKKIVLKKTCYRVARFIIHYVHNLFKWIAIINFGVIAFMCAIPVLRPMITVTWFPSVCWGAVKGLTRNNQCLSGCAYTTALVYSVYRLGLNYIFVELPVATFNYWFNKDLVIVCTVVGSVSMVLAAAFSALHDRIDLKILHCDHQTRQSEIRVINLKREQYLRELTPLAIA